MTLTLSIYVDGSFYEFLTDVNYEVLNDGLQVTGTGPKPASHKYSYSGANTLLGYSTSSSAVSPDTNFSVGDTGTIALSNTTISLYSVQQEPVDITISYKGSTIATMSASGTKTLLTEGKYCEDDIVVQYTRYSPEVYAGEHHAESRLISFSMPDADGAHCVCNAEPNMTFADWCASTYNTGFEARNWDAIGSQIVSGSWVLQLNGSNVLPTDTIQENAVYEQFYDD